MTLLLTGGHLTPALALIEHIRAQQPDTLLFFVGRLYSRIETKQPSREKTEVEKRGVTFIPFQTGKWGHGNVFQKFLQTLQFVPSFFKALFIVGSQKPDAVVSFGSYVAVPVAMAAWIWRIPVITHEQTRTAGFANTIISRFADKVAIAHQESAQFFPATKTVVTGNLLRPGIFDQTAPQPRWLTDTTSKPILYVTGGSQGSEVINTTIGRALQQLVKDWIIIHQCGNQTQSRNYYQELSAVKQALSPQVRKRYVIREWITEAELAWIYQHASAMVSRAGANTTEEISRTHIPAVLIPLPFSHRDEQVLNAKALSKTGGCILLPQQKLSPKMLVKHLDTIRKNHAKMVGKLEKLPQHPDAEAKLLGEIQKIIKH